MANPSTVHEPSMEEILASIRQIISEDGETSPAAPLAAKAQTPSPEPEAQSKPDAAMEQAGASTGIALEMGEAMKPQPLTIESPAKTSPVAAVPATEALRRPEFQPSASPARQPVPAERSSWQPEERHLLSSDSDAAVSGAFSALAHTILAQNARTLEDLVVDMLRPMLREWLDDNLPPLVERLVKEEIERVSRGRR